MSSTYAGLFVGQFLFPNGVPVTGAAFKVVLAGTSTTATVAADGNYTALANPLPLAAGLGQVGVDTEGNVCFFADTTVAYDVQVTYSNGQPAPPFRCHLAPDTRVLPLPAGTPTLGQVPVVGTVTPLAMEWGSGSNGGNIDGGTPTSTYAPGQSIDGGSP